MKKYQIESLKGWVDLEERHLAETKAYLVLAKWYQFLYKRNLRISIKRIEDVLERQRELLKQEVNKFYNL